MNREPFSSLDEMLTPSVLSEIAGSPINLARRLPFTGGHSASGSRFLAVETNDGRGPRFVVKQSSPAFDWIVRDTRDDHGREVLVWSSGLLDRLPPEITHSVIACAWDVDGWAILMRDVSHQLIPGPTGEGPITLASHRRYLDAFAALHAEFWERPEAAAPALGFCEPCRRYTLLLPENAHRATDCPADVERWIRNGWESLWPLLAPDLAALLRRLVLDPGPLCAAMARYPQTVIHGDLRGANLGMVSGSRRVVLIDWQLCGPGVPGADLAWYLQCLESGIPISQESSIAWYGRRLASRLGYRFDEQWWRPQLELSLLGQMVRGGWVLGWDICHEAEPAVRHRARRSLAWWSEQARAGAAWL